MTSLRRVGFSLGRLNFNKIFVLELLYRFDDTYVQGGPSNRRALYGAFVLGAEVMRSLAQCSGRYSSIFQLLEIATICLDRECGITQPNFPWCGGHLSRSRSH